MNITVSTLDEAILAIARAVPIESTLPTMDEMNARTQALACNSRVKLRAVGASRNGEAIEMLSIGDGPCSVLFVGTPHPNEAIGCLTIEYLMDRLLKDPALCEGLASRWSWHFIKSIEPDGLRLNESWLKAPFDPAAYLSGVFRPAAAEQAEYCFPVEAHGYHFDAATPETKAWTEALRLTRPDLLLSLHNCEHGGAYYILSRTLGDLAQRLSTQPQDFGVPLNPMGEGFDDDGMLAPGVYESLDIDSLLRRWAEAGSKGPAPWHAGQSSFGHTAAAGTLGLMIETPHWMEDPGFAADAPDVPLSTLFASASAWCEDTRLLIDRYLGHLKDAPGLAAPRFIAALRDFRNSAERGVKAYARPTSLMLTASNAAMQRRIVRLRQLRPIAMLARLIDWDLVRRPDAPQLHQAAREVRGYLTQALNDPLLAGGMKPVPLHLSVGLQVRAALTAMAALQQTTASS